MFWQFLKANWHTYELRVLENKVELRALIGEGNPAQIEEVGLAEFVGGSMQAKVTEFFGEDVKGEAIESAKWMLKHGGKPNSKPGFGERLRSFFGFGRSGK